MARDVTVVVPKATSRSQAAVTKTSPPASRATVSSQSADAPAVPSPTTRTRQRTDTTSGEQDDELQVPIYVQLTGTLVGCMLISKSSTLAIFIAFLCSRPCACACPLLHPARPPSLGLTRSRVRPCPRFHHLPYLQEVFVKCVAAKELPKVNFEKSYKGLWLGSILLRLPITFNFLLPA